MEGPHCVLLSVLHRTAGEARKASIHHQICVGKEWGADKKKMVLSAAMEGKKSEVLEELLWFNTLGNTGWCQFRQKEEGSFLGEDAVYLFTSTENVWTDFTLICAQKTSSNTPLDPSQMSSAWLPHICLFLCLAYSKKARKCLAQSDIQLKKPKTQTLYI